MTVINNTWELSPAFEQHCAEQRAHTAKVLSNFGAPQYNEWPAKAVITRVDTPTMHPSAMMNYVNLGQHGIFRSIKHTSMPDCGVVWPNQAYFDAWFVPAVHGNTDNAKCSDWELWSYICTPHDLVVIHLGCDHKDRHIVRVANQYKRYRCDICDYTWGVDTSD